MFSDAATTVYTWKGEGGRRNIIFQLLNDCFWLQNFYKRAMKNQPFQRVKMTDKVAPSYYYVSLSDFRGYNLTAKGIPRPPYLER